jgi:hypothetical protein
MNNIVRVYTNSIEYKNYWNEITRNNIVYIEQKTDNNKRQEENKKSMERQLKINNKWMNYRTNRKNYQLFRRICIYFILNFNLKLITSMIIFIFVLLGLIKTFLDTYIPIKRYGKK